MSVSFLPTRSGSTTEQHWAWQATTPTTSSHTPLLYQRTFSLGMGEKKRLRTRLSAMSDYFLVFTTKSPLPTVAFIRVCCTSFWLYFSLAFTTKAPLSTAAFIRVCCIKEWPVRSSDPEKQRGGGV